ncbi:hypothetical protein L211DRAFT_321468 [Terfezia boudieri ATCC MYA-4762]|uniref:Uncharacterized protein n=1 Tax=Terfezia boudieri ATCC MYA-4762 TaxID=1051890 RepID=A0A3N4LLV2_9PEZI|nr:hypothetical protein L211DRAFT_321468 [Terfezia boudieri ATCC MYA-4762]
MGCWDLLPISCILFSLLYTYIDLFILFSIHTQSLLSMSVCLLLLRSSAHIIVLYVKQPVRYNDELKRFNHMQLTLTLTLMIFQTSTS